MSGVPSADWPPFYVEAAPRRRVHQFQSVDLPLLAGAVVARGRDHLGAVGGALCVEAQPMQRAHRVVVAQHPRLIGAAVGRVQDRVRPGREPASDIHHLALQAHDRPAHRVADGRGLHRAARHLRDRRQQSPVLALLPLTCAAMVPPLPTGTPKVTRA